MNDGIPAKVAVAVSGSGRSLKNLLEREPRTLWRVSAVISSSPTCKANKVAKEAGLPLYVGDFSHAAAAATTREIADFIRHEKIDWIVLAGFLKLFPSIPGLERCIVNIHPALLPKYGGKGMHGMHVHAAVLSNRESESGASIHFVNERYDDGKLIANIKVPVAPTDSPDTLAARVFEAECRLLPEVITRLVSRTLPEADVWEMR